MDFKDFIVVPLHKHWHFLDDVAALLQAEWPTNISDNFRLTKLKSSCKRLPSSLILLHKSNDIESVVGHLRICPVVACDPACSIESVVISPDYRAKGLGSFLMLEMENYVKKKRKTVVYLSTTNRENFYKRLGYFHCNPLTLYGSLSKDKKKYHIPNISKDYNGEVYMNGGKVFSVPKEEPKPSTSKHPPPPPPPPPPLPSMCRIIDISPTSTAPNPKTMMKKFLYPLTDYDFSPDCWDGYENLLYGNMNLFKDDDEVGSCPYIPTLIEHIDLDQCKCSEYDDEGVLLKKLAKICTHILDNELDSDDEDLRLCLPPCKEHSCNKSNRVSQSNSSNEPDSSGNCTNNRDNGNINEAVRNCKQNEPDSSVNCISDSDNRNINEAAKDCKQNEEKPNKSIDHADIKQNDHNVIDTSTDKKNAYKEAQRRTASVIVFAGKNAVEQCQDKTSVAEEMSDVCKQNRQSVICTVKDVPENCKVTNAQNKFHIPNHSVNINEKVSCSSKSNVNHGIENVNKKVIKSLEEDTENKKSDNFKDIEGEIIVTEGNQIDHLSDEDSCCCSSGDCDDSNVEDSSSVDGECNGSCCGKCTSDNELDKSNDGSECNCGHNENNCHSDCNCEDDSDSNGYIQDVECDCDCNCCDDDDDDDNKSCEDISNDNDDMSDCQCCTASYIPQKYTTNIGNFNLVDEMNSNSIKSKFNFNSAAQNIPTTTNTISKCDTQRKRKYSTAFRKRNSDVTICDSNDTYKRSGNKNNSNTTSKSNTQRKRKYNTAFEKCNSYVTANEHSDVTIACDSNDTVDKHSDNKNNCTDTCTKHASDAERCSNVNVTKYNFIGANMATNDFETEHEYDSDDVAYLAINGTAFPDEDNLNDPDYVYDRREEDYNDYDSESNPDKFSLKI